MAGFGRVGGEGSWILEGMSRCVFRNFLGVNDRSKKIFSFSLPPEDGSFGELTCKWQMFINISVRTN